jgi:hypothetical protein
MASLPVPLPTLVIQGFTYVCWDCYSGFRAVLSHTRRVCRWSYVLLSYRTGEKPECFNYLRVLPPLE